MSAHYSWTDHLRSAASGSRASVELGVLMLLFALGAQAADPPAPVGAQSSLTADAFSAAVLARNADLNAMRETVVAAVAQITPASALDDPMLSVSSAPRTIGTATGVSGDIEVSQALPWFGTLDARKELAVAEAEVERHDFEALRLQLAALARGAFSDWVFVHRALDINAINQSVLADLRSVARARYASGLAPEEDVLQADVDSSILKQQRLELQRQSIVVQARMNALLDRPPHTAVADPGELPAVLPLPAEAVLAQRAAGHPQLEQLAAQERAAEAQERLQEKERFPKFSLSAGYNNMWADPAMRPMLGVSFSVPIDQGKYRAAIDAARALARRSASMLDDERASVLSDLAADYASTREAAQSLALYRDELLPLAQEALEVARSEYSSGRGDFLNVLTAERHQLDAQLALAHVRSEYYRGLAELDRASGGGLLADPTDSQIPVSLQGGGPARIVLP